MEEISAQLVEERIRAWAEITALSLELKLAAMNVRFPYYDADAVNEVMRKELSMLKIKPDG
jgi:hypothetical protein